jgi:ribosomal-protein-alanine N-acetyltransferase
MIRRDLPEVRSIERLCFENPWDDQEFIRHLRRRDCIGMVADLDDAVVGFMIYELHRTRLHLLNFAVDPTRHRLGIGSKMVCNLFSKLSAQRRTSLACEVRESNLSAQLFFKSLGFRAVNVLRDFYEDTDEDAILMSFRHPASRSNAPPRSLLPEKEPVAAVEVDLAYVWTCPKCKRQQTTAALTFFASPERVMCTGCETLYEPDQRKEPKPCPETSA